MWSWLLLPLIVLIALACAPAKRLKHIEEQLRSDGFDFQDSDFFAGGTFDAAGPFRSLNFTRDGYWCARGLVEGLRVTIWEHVRFAWAVGRNRQVVWHTAACVRCPDAWPPLRLARITACDDALAATFPGPSIHLRDEVFSASWRVWCTDEEFAVLFLTPQMRAWLMDRPRSSRFALGNGFLCAYKARRLLPVLHVADSEPVRRLVDEVLELHDLITSEVQEYGTAPAA
jgi:hypothetical protein